MVGDARHPCGSPAELTAGLRGGYDAAAGGWADGPGPMYAPLARALVAAAPVPLAGALVLDLGWTHPAKDAVDDVARSFGYRPPAWHTVLSPGSRASDPQVLAESAAAAGFTRVRARVTAVPTGLAAPAELAAWRLGMAHLAPFLRSLDPPGRAAVRSAAEQAVADTGPLTVSMVVLTAT